MTNFKPNLIIRSSLPLKDYIYDLWNYRELMYFFAWRDFIVRYKHAFFGIGWAVFRPLLTTIGFAFVFGHIANLPSGNVNYSLFVLAGLLPWQLFANCISESTTSLLNQSSLITKVYFPRMIIPAAQTLVQLVDFSIGLILFLAILCIVYNPIGWPLLYFPIFIALVVFLCLGCSFWLSALTARFRDIRFLVPFFVQFGLFLSPVGYGTFVIPDKLIWLYFCNPLVGIIDGFRWSCFGITHPLIVDSIAISSMITLLVFILGFDYFRRLERTLGDIL